MLHPRVVLLYLSASHDDVISGSLWPVSLTFSPIRRVSVRSDAQRSSGQDDYCERPPLMKGVFEQFLRIPPQESWVIPLCSGLKTPFEHLKSNFRLFK